MNGADVAAAENAVNKNAQFGIFKRPVLDIRTAFVRTYITLRDVPLRRVFHKSVRKYSYRPRFR